MKFNINRVTNVTLDVGLYPELSNEEKNNNDCNQNNNKITREELAMLIKKNTRTVQRILNGLASSGYLIRIGKNRFGYWEVIN